MPMYFHCQSWEISTSLLIDLLPARETQRLANLALAARTHERIKG
jgi:hypothetical protein